MSSATSGAWTSCPPRLPRCWPPRSGRGPSPGSCRPAARRRPTPRASRSRGIRRACSRRWRRSSCQRRMRPRSRTIAHLWLVPPETGATPGPSFDDRIEALRSLTTSLSRRSVVALFLVCRPGAGSVWRREEEERGQGRSDDQQRADHPDHDDDDGAAGVPAHGRPGNGRGAAQRVALIVKIDNANEPGPRAG